MNHIIINLSPREKGTSKMLTNYFIDRLSSGENIVESLSLYSHLEDMDTMLNKIKAADSIIMIGPSYVCSFPADTIRLLEKMSSIEETLHGQSLYGFIQGGMPYVHTHEHGIKLLENFCIKEGLIFKGGFVMGFGAMLDGRPLDKIMGAKKTVRGVNEFIEHIKHNEESSAKLYKDAAINIPYPIIKILSVMMNCELGSGTNVI